MSTPYPRQPAALAAKSRKAGYMHDRRAPRGGARNEMQSYLDEYLDEVVDEEDEFWEALFRGESWVNEMTLEDVEKMDDWE